jgi:hypothetical protein
MPLYLLLAFFVSRVAGNAGIKKNSRKLKAN